MMAKNRHGTVDVLYTAIRLKAVQACAQIVNCTTLVKLVLATQKYSTGMLSHNMVSACADGHKGTAGMLKGNLMRRSKTLGMGHVSWALGTRATSAIEAGSLVITKENTSQPTGRELRYAELKAFGDPGVRQGAAPDAAGKKECGIGGTFYDLKLLSHAP